MRWVVNDLQQLDEWQYFWEPKYDELTDYRRVIKEPLCLLTMRDRVGEGRYDWKGYELLKEDLGLIVRNALVYNMPHDNAYFQAKVLFITGSLLIDRMRSIIECP